MTDPQMNPQPAPQPAQPMPSGQPQPMQRKPLTVCGVIAVVLGILGFLLSFIPIVNNFAAVLGAIGAVLGIIAVVGTLRGKKRGKSLSIVATVLCALAVVITLVMQSAASKAVDNSIKQSKGVDTSQQSAAKSAGEQDTEGDIEGAHVKIVSAVKSVNDYEGNPTVLVTYEWTNTTSKNNSFAVLAHPQVFQNGKALDTAIYMDSPEGYDAGSYMAEVQPKANATVTLGYVLSDESPVTVDVTALISTDNTTKVVHTFDLQ